jgi:hypothetical protein
MTERSKKLAREYARMAVRATFLAIDFPVNPAKIQGENQA